jgi:hypothetical protein
VTGPEPDDLLWDLPRAGTEDDGPAPDDATLRAYRAGALPGQEETRLEWTLAGSRRGRLRLAELAGIGLTPRRRSRLPLVSAALAMAAMIAIAVLIVGGRERALPSFEVRVEGQADVRGAAGAARSLPGGTVRVRVEPRGEARAGVRFGAYRLGEGVLVPLREPEDVRIETNRGSALLLARAERLVGDRPGTRPFFVAVSFGQVPVRRLEVAPGGPEATLRRAGAGQAYRVFLTIVEAREGVR